MPEKIGVYFDKSCLGAALDVEALTEFVEKKWGGVVAKVESHAILASESGRALIQKDLDEGEIDGVLVCGASPRYDGEFYRFGPTVLVERCNLREHCILPYMNPDGSLAPAGEEGPEMMLQMAKDYISMSLVKLKQMKIPQPELFETTKTILVLGGGWTGLSAALNGAAAGYDVVLLERTDKLGGAALNMLKTVPLKYPHTTAHPTGIEDKVAAVEANAKIAVKLKSELTKLSGMPGAFEATVKGPGGETTIKIGSVVLATGWVAQDTKYVECLGYGKIKDVVTTAQFEKMAKAGEIKRPSNGAPAKKVAFILNPKKCEPAGPIYKTLAECNLSATVAAEGDPKAEVEVTEVKQQQWEGYQHLPMATAVNSLVALKQAGYVTEANPGDGIAYLFYDSMIVQGVHERFYKAAQDNPGVMMTKAEIADVTEEDGGVVVKATNTLLGHDLEVLVDLVVVPTGMVPTTAKEPVLHFDYRQGPTFPDLALFEGFCDSNYICFPYETRRTGVYAAGAVRQPMMMDSAEEDAAGATLKAIQAMESANRGVAVHPRAGDMSFPVFNFVRCTQCKRCTEECPFGALDDDEKGTPKPNFSRCRRCGTCMGACPERVISFDTYGIGMMSDVVKQYAIPDDINKGGPRVLIMACENDAYPALDMAARRGMHWSPYVRIMPVRCLGSVNAIWIKDAMSRGTDGVIMLGCKYGDDYQCHFVKGSEICNRRKENIAETLKQLGIEPERVEQYELAIDEYDKVPGLIDNFLKMVMKLGPNPFKGY
ncbi:hydrogenase iron-sulfur subunit [Megalodesulfovibrio paquesii]